MMARLASIRLVQRESALRARGVHIPAWVPMRYRAEFVEAALVFGEERAASHVRKLKREEWQEAES